MPHPDFSHSDGITFVGDDGRPDFAEPVQGSKRKGKGKEDKAYGPDILRLWVATVEFGKDMTIGPTVLQQCAETMRKIRNSSRFILGSLGDRPFEAKVERRELGLADRYVLHRLHRLDAVARAGYEAYNFPQGAHVFTVIPSWWVRG